SQSRGGRARPWDANPGSLHNPSSTKSSATDRLRRPTLTNRRAGPRARDRARTIAPSSAGARQRERVEHAAVRQDEAAARRHRRRRGEPVARLDAAELATVLERQRDEPALALADEHEVLG